MKVQGIGIDPGKVQHIALVLHDSLGGPGGSGGIENIGQVPGIDRDAQVSSRQVLVLPGFMDIDKSNPPVDVISQFFCQRHVF